MRTNQHSVYCITAAVIAACALFLQNRFLIHWDVSWDILVTERLLAGGTYSQHFFDLNPPAIFFIYSPAIWVAHKLQQSTIDIFRVYIFMLMSLSMILNYQLLLGIFSLNQSRVRYIFFISLMLVIFILPNAQFGEREHIFLVLTLPYFLSTALYVQRGKYTSLTTPSRTIALIIGLLAFLGFAIKPYFLCPFLLIEGYCLFKKRCWLSWLRIETLTILCLLAFYPLFVWVYYPDYLLSVVPLALQYYSSGFYTPLTTLLNNTSVYFMIIMMLWYVIFCYLDKRDYILATILWISWMGCFSIYLLQHTVWRYHLYPAFAMSILLGTVLSTTCFERYPKQAPALWVFMIYLTIIPIGDTLLDYKNAMLYKKNVQPFINYLEQAIHQKSVYFIATSPREVFPAVQYAHTPYASRLLHFFWIPHIVKTHYQLQPSPTPTIYPIEHGENQFIQMVADDIAQNKPEYIFIDTKPFKGFLGSLPFNYLPYLLHNPAFETAWAAYHYEKTISHGTLYRYAIYRRSQHIKNI